MGDGEGVADGVGDGVGVGVGVGDGDDDGEGLGVGVGAGGTLGTCGGCNCWTWGRSAGGGTLLGAGGVVSTSAAATAATIAPGRPIHAADARLNPGRSPVVWAERRNARRSGVSLIPSAAKLAQGALA